MISEDAELADSGGRMSTTTSVDQMLDEVQPPTPTVRDYQAFWTTHARAGWTDAVLGEVRSWALRRLGLDVNVAADGEAISAGGDRRAEVMHRQAGKESGVRVRVWNTNGSGTFIVTILAVEDPTGGWILLQTESSDRAQRAAKPAVADAILGVVEFEDIVPLRATAQHVPRAALENLEALLGNPSRRLPVLVAAPIDGVDFDRWIRAVDKWTRHCAGIAHVFSLDPRSAELYRQRHGRRAVAAGTVRTYPARTDLDDPATDTAARWISAETLAGSDSAVARIVERFVRQHQQTHPVLLPPGVRSWSRAFDRFAAQRLRSAVTPTTSPLEDRVAARQATQTALRPAHPSPVVTPAKKTDKADLDTGELLATAERALDRLRAQLEVSERLREQHMTELRHVQEFLALPNLQDDALLELLDAATRVQPDSDAITRLLADNDSLRGRVETLEDLLVEEQIDAADILLERDRLDTLFAAKTREAAFLRGKVAEYDPASAYSWVDDETPSNPLGAPPGGWEGFLTDSRLAEHGLVFTGNPRTVKDIKSLDLDLGGLPSAWDALGTLAAYRQARLHGLWEGGVHAFCESGPADSFHVPPNKHARDESSATRKDSRLAGYRLLPVPKTVDPTGHVHMWSHFKPYSWSAHQKLRIHYHDQVTVDEKIYIGHVGQHLPSGSTDKVRR
ncbi:hypothetical protein [Curtobacterium citreum]|uniref:Uncharacterized protein n=1 Tax=Curtobacterium citreum TaxID=2036 RepID=A0ABT2HM45_9MICO|nr:hypothetical protein [Curtobacterium citreum]MCS6524228.1 hypothetical protein [Curtobacterium citreum]